MEWKTINGYSRYVISNTGSIKNLKTERTLKIRLMNGYPMLNLRSDIGGVKSLYIHRILAECFIHTIPKGMVVDHINRKRTDNRLTNLRIVDTKTNLQNSSRRKGRDIIKEAIKLYSKGYTLEEIYKEMIIL